VRIIRSIGIGGMLIPAVSVLAAITLMPAMLAVLGERINSVRLLPKRLIDHGHPEDGAWGRWARFVLRRPRLVAFAGIVIILIITAVAHYLNGGIRVQGGFCSIARLTSTHFDAVSTVLGVDPGGTLAGVQILGSLFYSFNAGDPQAAHPAFSIRDPSPDNHGNPVCRLSVTDCEFGFVSGAIFDIEGVNVSEVKISDCKLTRHAHTATPGTYHALRIAAPNAKLTFSNNDILPASRLGRCRSAAVDADEPFDEVGGDRRPRRGGDDDRVVAVVRLVDRVREDVPDPDGCDRQREQAAAVSEHDRGPVGRSR